MNEKTRVLMFASLMIPDGSSSFLPLRQGLTDKVPILCFAVRLAQRAYSSKSRISHFLGTLADYEKKSSGGILWGTAYTWKEVEKPCDLPKEFFTLMGVLGRSVRGLPAYLLGKKGDKGAMFLLEIND